MVEGAKRTVAISSESTLEGEKLEGSGVGGKESSGISFRNSAGVRSEPMAGAAGHDCA